MKKNLIQDLLTENKYWTFWSDSWTIKVNVLWNGKTKWSAVKKAISDQYFPHGMGFGYERQVELKEPDITFA